MNKNENKELETPLYDKLRPRYQAFINSYLRCFSCEQAAKDAGYAEDKAFNYGREIMKNDEVIAAMRELLKAQFAEIELHKDTIRRRLFQESIVSIEDLVKYDAEQKRFVPRCFDEVPEEMRHCLSLVSVTREKQIRFEKGAQDAARKRLAEYMLWDREERDKVPAVQMNFHGIKDKKYIKPS